MTRRKLDHLKIQNQNLRLISLVRRTLHHRVKVELNEWSQCINKKRVLDCLILSFLLKSEGLSTKYSERNCDHDTNVPAWKQCLLETIGWSKIPYGML